jgi:hypothetical protein
MASEDLRDAEVLPLKRFITHTARTFTLREIVKERVREGQHWVILCTPDCGAPALTCCRKRERRGRRRASAARRA